MSAYEYPGVANALAAGREVLTTFAQGGNFMDHISTLANDLWTLQGYAQSTLVGAPKAAPAELTFAVGTPADFAVEQQKAIASLKSFVDKGNQAQANQKAMKGLDFSSIDWNTILSWLMKIFQMWNNIQPKTARAPQT